jgi:hypothetical protein
MNDANHPLGGIMTSRSAEAKKGLKYNDLRAQIIEAFRSSQFKWRTARSVAKQTKNEISAVLDFLESSPDILRAKKANKLGHPLYTLRDRYRNEASFSKRILDAMANEPE